MAATDDPRPARPESGPAASRSGRGRRARPAGFRGVAVYVEGMLFAADDHHLGLQIDCERLAGHGLARRSRDLGLGKSDQAAVHSGSSCRRRCRRSWARSRSAAQAHAGPTPRPPARSRSRNWRRRAGSARPGRRGLRTKSGFSNVRPRAAPRRRRVPSSSRRRGQPLDADDDVRIDVGRISGAAATGQDGEGLHVRTPDVGIAPATAAAAAMAGLARWVRAPGPCRPTKLRFEVQTDAGPAAPVRRWRPRTCAPGFPPLEPGVAEDRVQPFGLGGLLTATEPGTTQAWTPAHVRPRATRAASRRSDSRELAQEPMKTQSTGARAMGCPASVPCSPAPPARSRCVGSGVAARVRERPADRDGVLGEYPRSTVGRYRSRRRQASRGRTSHPSSVRSLAQSATAWSNARRPAQTGGRADSRTPPRPARRCRTGAELD